MQSATKSCNLLQSHAICCKVMQSATKSCNLLQSHAICYKVMQSATKSCNLLQSHAICYKVMQSATESCNLIQSRAIWYRVMQFDTESCNLIQNYALSFTFWNSVKFLVGNASCCNFRGNSSKRTEMWIYTSKQFFLFNTNIFQEDGRLKWKCFNLYSDYTWILLGGWKEISKINFEVEVLIQLNSLVPYSMSRYNTLLPIFLLWVDIMPYSEFPTLWVDIMPYSLVH
jgi:hypothetical protein